MGSCGTLAPGQRSAETSVSMRARWGCVALIAYPLVEIAVAVLIASYIGWWWVFAALILSLAFGLGIVRWSLAATGQAWSAAISTLRTPSGEAMQITAGAQPVPTRRTPPAQTSLLVPAGLLIAIPGFCTTIAGLVLLLPPVRARIAARMQRAIRRADPSSAAWPSDDQAD